MQANASKAEALLKQLANGNRLMILCHLIQAPMSVNSLSEAIGLGQSAVSQHLAKLREEQIVETQRQGKQVLYSITSLEVKAILSTLYLIYCR